MVAHDKTCPCYTCDFQRKQFCGTPGRTARGPFHTAVLELCSKSGAGHGAVKCVKEKSQGQPSAAHSDGSAPALRIQASPRRCPYCMDCTLAQESLSSARCCYPQPDTGGPVPDHVYNFEWQRHFVEQHEHMLPRVEALYKAVWKRYINSPELQCPIVGLTLPIVHSTPPTFNPPEYLHSAVQHLEVAQAFLETLHMKSCYQRCCAVCGLTGDGRCASPQPATHGRAPPTATYGQWGEAVQWEKHILREHLHEVLLAAREVLGIVDSSQVPVPMSSVALPRVNHLRAARLQRQEMRRTGHFNRPATAPAHSPHTGATTQGPLAHTAPHATTQPGQTTLLRGATSTLERPKYQRWRWNGIAQTMAPDAAPSKGLAQRYCCPLVQCPPDFVGCGKVREGSFYRTFSEFRDGVPMKQQTLGQSRCRATFDDREVLVQHLVKYHGTQLVHEYLSNPNKTTSTLYTNRLDKTHTAHTATTHGSRGHATVTSNATHGKGAANKAMASEGRYGAGSPARESGRNAVDTRNGSPARESGRNAIDTRSGSPAKDLAVSDKQTSRVAANTQSATMPGGTGLGDSALKGRSSTSGLGTTTPARVGDHDTSAVSKASTHSTHSAVAGGSSDSAGSGQKGPALADKPAARDGLAGNDGARSESTAPSKTGLGLDAGADKAGVTKQQTADASGVSNAAGSQGAASVSASSGKDGSVSSSGAVLTGKDPVSSHGTNVSNTQQQQAPQATASTPAPAAVSKPGVVDVASKGGLPAGTEQQGHGARVAGSAAAADVSAKVVKDEVSSAAKAASLAPTEARKL